MKLLFCLLAVLPGLRADIDGDGFVGLSDLAILAEEWLMSELGPEKVTNGGFASGQTGPM